MILESGKDTNHFHIRKDTLLLRIRTFSAYEIGYFFVKKHGVNIIWGVKTYLEPDGKLEINKKKYTHDAKGKISQGAT